MAAEVFGAVPQRMLHGNQRSPVCPGVPLTARGGGGGRCGRLRRKDTTRRTLATSQMKWATCAVTMKERERGAHEALECHALYPAHQSVKASKRQERGFESAKVRGAEAGDGVPAFGRVICHVTARVLAKTTRGCRVPLAQVVTLYRPRESRMRMRKKKERKRKR